MSIHRLTPTWIHIISKEFNPPKPVELDANFQYSIVYISYFVLKLSRVFFARFLDFEGHHIEICAFSICGTWMQSDLCSFFWTLASLVRTMKPCNIVPTWSLTVRPWIYIYIYISSHKSKIIFQPSFSGAMLNFRGAIEWILMKCFFLSFHVQTDDSDNTNWHTHIYIIIFVLYTIYLFIYIYKYTYKHPTGDMLLMFWWLAFNLFPMIGRMANVSEHSLISLWEQPVGWWSMSMLVACGLPFYM